MCAVCLQNPCHPRCPNAPEPEPIRICKECGYGIYEGDRYFDTGTGWICNECLEDMSVETLLSLAGEKLETAELEVMYG